MSWIPGIDWLRARLRPAKALERRQQLLQGRASHSANNPVGRNEATGPRPGHKTAPIQASFASMSNSRDQDDPQALVAEAEAAGETLARVRAEIGKAVFGQ